MGSSDRPSGQAGGKAGQVKPMPSIFNEQSIDGTKRFEAGEDGPSPLAGEGGARRASGGRVRGGQRCSVPAYFAPSDSV